MLSLGTTFGAVCPARGAGAAPPSQGQALVLPFANTEAMNLHLKEISTQVKPGAHAVLVLDNAGWHQTGGRLVVPDNISLLHLPPYSPELNPVENVRQYLRQNYLSNRMRPPITTEMMADAGQAARRWSSLGRISSRFQGSNSATRFTG